MNIPGQFLTIIIVTLMTLGTEVIAQVPVQMSQNIETFEGKAYYLHTVEAQQTLYSVAKAYGVSVETILLNNPDARRGLRVNQVIRIPVSQAAALSQQPQPQQRQQSATSETNEFEYIYHVAGKGETYAYVASVYMVPERRIRDANPNRTEPFREGDYILIPIMRKDRRPPVTESTQLRRSGFDPYNTPTQRQQSGPTRRDLVEAATGSGNPQPAKSTENAQIPRPTDASASPAQRTKPQPSPQPAPKASASPLMPDNYTPDERPSENTNPSRHIVRPQETLFSIARQYNLTAAQLQQANPGLSENIQVGQVLLIPSATHTAAGLQQNTSSVNQGEIIIHTVERGETLFRISRNYGLTIDELKRLNPGLTESLATGQQIKVLKKKIDQPYLLHHVDKRQKTKQLAREYGLSAEEIQQVNPSIGKNVFPNQEVKIPLATKPIAEAKPIARGQEPLTPVQAKAKTTDDFAATAPKPETISSTADQCLPVATNAHVVYKIALMLPLYLQEVTTAQRYTNRLTPDEAPRGLSFLQFYQGFKLAADSLAAHFGLRAELLVYDVDQTPASVQQALSDPRLKYVDLIVGPLFGQSFDQVALFALQHKIPIVNPFTLRRQVIQDNPWVIKLKPDQSSLFDQLAKSLTAAYPEAGVIVLHAPGRNQQEASQLVQAFEQVILKRPKVANSSLIRALSSRSAGPAYLQSGGRYISLDELRLRPLDSTLVERRVSRLVFDRNDLTRFKEVADTWRNNIVVVYSDDRAYVMDVMNRLNQVADELNIQLVGLPEWRRYDNLFIEHMVRLNLHLADASFVNYDDPKVKFFTRQYKNRYNLEPNHYAFEGFDTGWYFLHMLQRQGKNFIPCLPSFSTWLMTNTFRFSRLSESEGFENQNWNISRVRNYRFEPLEINR